MANRKIGRTAIGLTCLLAWAGLAVAAPPPIGTIRVASGLSSPLYVNYAPGDFQRLFIVEQCGRIKILKNGTVLPTLYLNISTRVTCAGEQGLLGLAFHPDYQNNGYFYVNYTNLSGTTVIARYQVTANPEVADFGSETILLTISQPFTNHNGGWIAFGPDGYLYIATGDGGSGNDPGNRGQNINVLLGKMLRIDVDGEDNIPGNDDDDGVVNDPPTTGGYTSPPTNPFVGVAGSDEIWAYGLRNPWRNAFDRLTGDLYIADVGQNAVEEVNFQPASALNVRNYGWRCMEGTSCTGLSGCTCNSPSLTLPIHTYTHTANNCSITGGYNYRGCNIPGMEGTYFFADYCSNKIWSFKFDGVNKTEFADRTAELAPGGGLAINSITSFGEDAYGEIYICDQGGEVFKIVPDDAQPDCNANGRADACDIASGVSQDANQDGIPDECIIAPPAPAAEPGGVSKSRAVSTLIPSSATAAGNTTALQITLSSLHHPNPPYTGGPASDFSAFEGQVRWVGPPTTYVESSNNPSTFTAAHTQCEPYYHNWAGVGLVHVFGNDIVPSSTYTIRQFSDACQGNEGACVYVSDGLEVSTTRWGDIFGPFNPPSPSVQPDFNDIAALVNKFTNSPGAISKTQAALSGEIPDLSFDIGFTHISACVDAFRGLGYPHGGPTPCP